MVYNNALKTYQRTSIETADPLKLVIMCYDAAIHDLEEAKQSHEDQHMDLTYDKIRHAQDIITELLVGLDYERGGDIAQNLSRLYNFVLRQLIGINSRQESSMYDHLIHILAELKEAWEQIHQGMPQSPQPPAAGQSWKVSA